MEERKTNKHGLGLTLRIRREKFWALFWDFCASVAMFIRAKFTHCYHERWLILSRWIHCSQLLLQQPLLSDRRLSLTVANFSLFTALGYCLSSSSSVFVGNFTCKPFVWVSRQNILRNPLTGAHPHSHNECSLLWHSISIYYFHTVKWFQATIPSESWPGSTSNEGVFHISQRSRTGALPSDGLVPYLGHSLGVGFWDSVVVLHNPSRLGCI